MSKPFSEDWDILVLGDLARVYSGGTPSRRVTAYWNGSVPWVTTAEIDSGCITSTHQTITDAGLKASAARIAPAGTILLAMYGQGKTRGKAAMLGIPAAMNQACAAIEVNSKLDSRYLLHYLSWQYDVIRSMSNAGSQDNLSGELVRKIPIAVPRMAEQHAIAVAIDDAAIMVSRLEGSIAKKRAIKQGMMQQLLTGRTRLPGFSAPWNNYNLGSHVTYLKTVPLSRAQLDSDSPLRYLHYGDIHTNAQPKLDAAKAAMPRAPIALAQAADRLQPGDLVFADASEDTEGVGKSVEIVSVSPDGVVPGLHTIAARFDKSVLTDGFKAYLQFIPAFRNSLLRLAAGTKVLATTRAYISSIVLPLPSAVEQHAIAGALSDIDKEIDTLILRLDKAQAIKQGMMQQLLTGRTRLPVPEATS
jgi:type I restriction enzyme, S subunit